jgi:isoquinoline 1-oxidoreductase beta subunit
MQDGVLEVWGGHQMPTLYQQVAADLAGIPPEKVKLHVMMTGGGFGRRATPDAEIIVEAVATAKAIGWRAPVKVQWTREDDMAGGRYRPIYVHRISAGLSSEGKPMGWHHRIVGQSIIAGSPFASMMKNGVDPTSVEGASNLPYAIPDLRVDLVTTDVGVPVLWWRSVGSTHTAYSTEVMIDQLAYAAKADPVAFRRDLLKDHPRHLGVLDLAAEKAGWGTPLPPGKARGIASTNRSTPTLRRSPRSPRGRMVASRSSASSVRSIAAYRSTPTSFRRRWRAALASAWAPC